MTIFEKVSKELQDYGIKIINFYNLENNQIALYTDDMILFIGEKEKTIGLSFYAPTIPERVATLTLLIKGISIKGITIYVMESFIFDENKDYVSGAKAFKILKKQLTEKIINNYVKEREYEYVLENYKGYLC